MTRISVAYAQMYTSFLRSSCCCSRWIHTYSCLAYSLFVCVFPTLWFVVGLDSLSGAAPQTAFLPQKKSGMRPCCRTKLQTQTCQPSTFCGCYTLLVSAIMSEFKIYICLCEWLLSRKQVLAHVLNGNTMVTSFTASCLECAPAVSCNAMPFMQRDANFSNVLLLYTLFQTSPCSTFDVQPSKLLHAWLIFFFHLQGSGEIIWLPHARHHAVAWCRRPAQNVYMNQCFDSYKKGRAWEHLQCSATFAADTWVQNVPWNSPAANLNSALYDKQRDIEDKAVASWWSQWFCFAIGSAVTVV